MPIALLALTAGAFGIGTTEFVIMGLLLQVSADLQVSLTEARRRATRRPVHLTDDEFVLLHSSQPDDRALYDHVIDVDGLDHAAQVEAVRRVWS